MIYKLIKLITAPSSIYVIIRYFTYILQFVNAILLARYLDVFYFGVYSFINLVMQYMSYSNLGINESLNTEYSTNKQNISRLNDIWNNAWSINVLWNIFIMIGFYMILSMSHNLFGNYEFDNYKYLLLATCIIVNLSRIYITYYKLQGKLFKINVQQLLPNVCLFLLTISIRERLNISIILYTLLICHTLTLLIFRIGIPSIPKFSLDRYWVIVLIKRGIALLLYNLSFYILTLVASSFVSAYYSVEMFGCYSFANTLVNGVIMAGGAFMFIFYPKILNRLNTDNIEAYGVIKKIREVYIVFMDIVSLLSIVGVFVISPIISQYGEVMITLYSMLILGRIVNNSSTGYAALLISRGKEQLLIIYGFLSVFILLACSLCIYVFNFDIHTVALSIAVASFIYTYLVIRSARSSLKISVSCRLVIKEIFGVKKWLICLIILLYTFILHSPWFLLAGIFTYCAMNSVNIKKSITSGYTILIDKNALSF